MRDDWFTIHPATLCENLLDRSCYAGNTLIGLPSRITPTSSRD